MSEELEQERTTWGTLYFCLHCGDRKGKTGLYDEKCSTIEKRREMDKKENENWQEHFGKDYPCKLKCLI